MVCKWPNKQWRLKTGYLIPSQRLGIGSLPTISQTRQSRSSPAAYVTISDPLYSSPGGHPSTPDSPFLNVRMSYLVVFRLVVVLCLGHNRRCEFLIRVRIALY